ncbi:conserved hypothetical protein [Burkholderia sp. H160]|nr:conserved hypothetical protein [Burkholderia sp. H160]
MKSASEIVDRATALRVRLWIEGERVNMAGPARNVAAIKPEIAAHKPEIIAHLRAAAGDIEPGTADCVGALRDAAGGFFLPWGPYLEPDDLRELRAGLHEAIGALATLEGWTDAYRRQVLGIALHAPLSALLPDIHYFTDRLKHARTEALARELAAQRAWRYDGRR